MTWRVPVATIVALLAAAAPAGAAQPIMPLSEVHAGMQCTGLTVLRGDQISPFEVDVVDVVDGDPVDDSPLILVRVVGQVADDGGVAEGFSGSPVVCDGRIAGAIAYGIGDYGNILALATPIEAVIGEPVSRPAGERREAALLRRARPLSAPLTVGGVAPAVLGPFARAAAGAGITLSAVPAAPLAGRFPPQTLQPGASMAAGFASGDITAGAVGTVSYVDGDRVWGFGHPLDAAGRRSLFLQDAWVYTIVANPLDVGDATSFKLAVPGHDLGTLTEDGRSGVGGVVGELPPHVALRIATRDTATGRVRRIRASVADETGVGLPTGSSPLSLVAPMAVSEAAYTALDGSPAMQSATMCVRLRLAQLPHPTGFCNRYVGSYGAGGGDGPVGGPYVHDLVRAVTDLDGYAYGAPRVRSLDVALSIAPGLSLAMLRGAHAPATARRGRALRLRLDLQRYRGPRFHRTVRVRVPRDLPPGRQELTLTGTDPDGGMGGGSRADAQMLQELADLFDKGGDPEADGPRSFAQLGAQIAGISRYDGVTIRFGKDRPRPLLRDPKVRIAGQASVRVTVRR